MLKTILASLAAIILLALLAGGLVVGAKSVTVRVNQQDYQNCLASYQTEHNNKPDCPKKETLWDRGLEDPVAYYTLWLAFFTIALAVGGLVQSVLIGRQIRLARDEFNATHLPNIEIQRIHRENFDIGKHAGVSFLIANTGETGATIETINIAIEILPRLPAIRTPVRWDAMYGAEIGIPAQAGHAISVTRLGLLTDAEYDAIQAGFRHVFLLVEIEYRNAGGTRRSKGFCFVFDLSQDRFTLRTDPNYTYGS